MPSQTSSPAASKTADTAAAIHPLLAERWSPRAFDPDHVLDADTLTALLEAARWAPSSSNSQPWRFTVARRGTAAHAAVVDALAEGNRKWAPHASALIIASATDTDAKDRALRWASYDTGQAIAHLTLQAEELGLSTHQMGGFDADAVGALLDDDAVTPLVVLAVGVRTAPDQLDEGLAERERASRQRRPLEELLIPVRTG